MSASAESGTGSMREPHARAAEERLARSIESVDLAGGLIDVTLVSAMLLAVAVIAYVAVGAVLAAQSAAGGGFGGPGEAL